jgi:hypothetical protein
LTLKPSDFCNVGVKCITVIDRQLFCLKKQH